MADVEPVGAPVVCDVAVVGGGPAGIAAATRAAESGARVVVIDQGLRPGGQVWRHLEPGELPALARRWLERCTRAAPRWLDRARVVDVLEDRSLLVARDGAERGERALVVQARAIVLATGARELFVPYPGWTLPNVMGLGGAQALLKGGAEVRGARVVLAGSGPLILPVAAALARADARLAVVAEQAPWSRVARFAAGLWSHPRKLAQALAYRQAFRVVPYRTGVWVESAEGDGRVQRATLTNGRRRWSETCDLLCCSHGLVPETALARLIGCSTNDGRVVVDSLQRTTVPGVYCAGEPTGIAGEVAALVQGEIAGLAAAGRVADAGAPRLQRARESWRIFASQLATTFALRHHVRALPQRDTIICRCEDVPLHRIDPIWSARQAKLYTRLGMGPCQGAICGPACGIIFGWDPDTVRPPIGGARLDVSLEGRGARGQGPGWAAE